MPVGMSAFAWSVAAGRLPVGIGAALIVGGALVGGVGWIDDHRPPARAHAWNPAVAAAWAVFWLGGLPAVDLAGHSLPLGGAGSLLAVLFLVWTTTCTTSWTALMDWLPAKL